MDAKYVASLILIVCLIVLVVLVIAAMLGGGLNVSTG